MYMLSAVHCLLNASPPALGKRQPPGWMLQGERAGGAEFSAPWSVKAGVLAEWQVCPLSLALPASLPFSRTLLSPTVEPENLGESPDLAVTSGPFFLSLSLFLFLYKYINITAASFQDCWILRHDVLKVPGTMSDIE